MVHSASLSIPALVALLVSLISAQLGSPITPRSATQTNSAAPTTTPTTTPTTAPADTTPTRTPAPQVTHQLIFVSDSLTEGVYATTPQQGYAYRTAAQTHASFEVQGEYGVSAVFTAQKMQASNPKLKVVSGDALDVIIELGTNDVVASGEMLAQFKSSYDYILSRVHQDAPNAKLICLGVWRDPTAGAQESGYAYNQIIQADCPGTYVPLGDLYMNNSLHGPASHPTWIGNADWFHPNDTGHAAIAARVAAAVA